MGLIGRIGPMEGMGGMGLIGPKEGNGIDGASLAKLAVGEC